MNKGLQEKQTGDSHPPDLEVEPEVSATDSALGIPSRARMRVDPELPESDSAQEKPQAGGDRDESS